MNFLTNIFHYSVCTIKKQSDIKKRNDNKFERSRKADCECLLYTRKFETKKKLRKNRNFFFVSLILLFYFAKHFFSFIIYLYLILEQDFFVHVV